MYGKVFASLYQGTLRGNSHAILVFTNLIACADRYGIADKHWRAIAEEVGLSVEEVKSAIAFLESPDPESRSSEAGGARIIKMEDTRNWGWQIVNYSKYREIRSTEDRRTQTREAMRRMRARDAARCEPDVSHCEPRLAQGEGDVQAQEVSNSKLERERVADAPTPKSRFAPPTAAEVRDYAESIDVGLDAEKFVDYYESKGWVVGKSPMKSWKAAVRTWAKNTSPVHVGAAPAPDAKPKPHDPEQVRWALELEADLRAKGLLK